MKQAIWWIMMAILPAACQSGSPPVENIETPPPVGEADRPFAGVFQPLDGTWEGVFRILEDSLGQREMPVQPRDPGQLPPGDRPLRLGQRISVRQEYVSESPYFQRVRIWDTYVDAAGDSTVIESRGVNKIQDGRMWCVVVKPADTVIHHGSADGPQTIIWQRDERDPLRIEYFRETVSTDSYRIRGWGYYGDDDPTLSPKLWFLGDYRRVH